MRSPSSSKIDSLLIEMRWASMLHNPPPLYTASIHRILRSETFVLTIRLSHRSIPSQTWAFYLDADVTMRTHVIATVRSCFAALRQIRDIRRSLTRHALLDLIRAQIVSTVDYGNSVLTDISVYLTDKFQSVHNAAARLVISARRSNHITSLIS